MATVRVYTAARMQAIEDAAITGGYISGDDLILVANDSSEVNAGNVRGPQGDVGPTGDVSTAQLNAALATTHDGTDMQNGSIVRAHLETDIINGTKIEDDAVANEHIAASAVQAEQLATNSVTGVKIADGAVDTDELATGAVTQAKLASGSVGNAELLNGSVGNSKLAADAVTTSKIGDNAVGIDQMANDAVGFNEMVDSASGGTLAGGDINYFKLLDYVFVFGSSVSQADPVATLPSGYRPPDYVGAPLISHLDEPDRVIIDSSGNIKTDSPSGGGVVAFFICFKAA